MLIDAYYHRIVQSGDIWRTRAATAATFFTTVAATLVTGLLVRGVETFHPWPMRSGVAAVVLFVAAAATLTVAALRKSPAAPSDPRANDAFVETAISVMTTDRNAVLRWVQVGVWAGGLGLACAGLTLVLALNLVPNGPSVSVVLTPSGVEAVKGICPTITGEVKGRLVEREDTISVRLDELCNGFREIGLRPSEVAVVARRP